MMKRFALVLLILATTALLSYGQPAGSGHSVSFTIVDNQNPQGQTTYTVYRATGLCSGSPAFTKLATGLTTLTYQDTTVIPGNYCYYVTATVNSIESAPSNMIPPLVQPFTVTITLGDVK